MSTDKISSDESEGAFNEFIQDQLDNIIENILNEGDLSNFGERGSDIIVEIDDIVVPTFTYGEEGEGGGAGNSGPGKEGGKIRFNIPFNKLMERIAQTLNLPNLIKEGKGRIKEFDFTR